MRVPGVTRCAPPVWPRNANVCATASQLLLRLPSAGTLGSQKQAGRLRHFTPRTPISDGAELVPEVKAMNGRRALPLPPCSHTG